MKASAFDTFCRALVLGAVFGAVGWGSMRYTNFPQMALEKVVALSREMRGQSKNTGYMRDASVTSANSPALTSATNTISQTPNTQHDLLPIHGVPSNILPHPTQQAAYLEPSVAPQNSHTPSSQPGDIRTEIEQRLFDLGAVYSLLEMWGNENIRYRFHCRVGIANNRQVTRSFEANGKSPEEAMQHVLQEVEGFQSTSSLQGPDVR